MDGGNDIAAQLVQRTGKDGRPYLIGRVDAAIPSGSTMLVFRDKFGEADFIVKWKQGKRETDSDDFMRII